MSRIPTNSDTQLDKFTLAYIEAALWSETDDDGEPLDAKYSIENISSETLREMRTDCERFQAANREHIPVGCEEQAGHDFWLTRNGHGAGFWDGDWIEPAASALDKAASAFGEFELYIGDDGQVWA